MEIDTMLHATAKQEKLEWFLSNHMITKGSLVFIEEDKENLFDLIDDELDCVFIQVPKKMNEVDLFEVVNVTIGTFREEDCVPLRIVFYLDSVSLTTEKAIEIEKINEVPLFFAQVNVECEEGIYTLHETAVMKRKG